MMLCHRYAVRHLALVLLAAVFALSSCGLLNAALGASGAAPNANTPEAEQAARSADEKALDWLYLIFGIGGAAGGAVAENRRQKRKQRKASAGTGK